MKDGAYVLPRGIENRWSGGQILVVPGEEKGGSAQDEEGEDYAVAIPHLAYEGRRVTIAPSWHKGECVLEVHSRCTQVVASTAARSFGVPIIKLYDSLCIRAVGTVRRQVSAGCRIPPCVLGVSH